LDWKVSIRRACAALRIDRALYVYKSKRGGQADLKQRIKEIAETRVRYGDRRIHVLLQREGWAVNPKRIYRLYKDLGFQLRHKTPKRRVIRFPADRLDEKGDSRRFAKQLG
jgi:putative transposase